MNFKVPIEFFPMEEKDLKGVAALESEVQPFPWSRELFGDSLHNGHSCWVCRIGGELAGFSIMMLVVDEAHLLNIAVRPSLQGQGLGARL
ncbi:MAG: GNAT family N-acetyltransferase, partial [Betaproteobacteria bacterium]